MFEEALEQCRARTELAARVGHLVGLIGASASPVEPPEGHKVRLMARIAATPQSPSVVSSALPVPALRSAAPSPDTPPVRARRWVLSGAWPLATAAAAILIVLLSVWLANVLGSNAEQQVRISDLQGQVVGLQGKVNIPDGYRAMALAPTAEYTGVSALVLYNPESNEVWLVADGLKPLPEDLVYELWLIHPPGQGRSDVGGVFQSSASGTAVHTTSASKNISDYAGFAVSIEKKPGVQVREGPVVVVGRFEGQ